MRLPCWMRVIQKPPAFKQIIALAGMSFLVMVMLAIIVNEQRTWAVQVGDRVVAVVADQEAARAALKEVTLSRTQAAGKPVSPAERVIIRRASGNDGKMVVSVFALKEILEQEVSFKAGATALMVNGEKKLILPDYKTARALLEKVKEQYKRNPGDQVAFAEDIRLENTTAQLEQILTFEEALAAIKGEAKGVHAYTVKEGDTLWDIAKTARQDVNSIQSINHGLFPERLRVGQDIYLSRQVPVVNVVTITRPVVKEEIPFSVEERKDNSLYRGQYRVVQQGGPGQKEVTYEVTCVNGIEKSRQVIKEEVLKKPAVQVVAKGSRWLLASRSGGSGRLAWPVGGAIVSSFGNRRGEFHAGIDIGAASGVPVAAAESGEVIRAGWYSGYGKCVDISHGNGVLTRYAHLSAISVRVGERVNRGQMIGRVGSTGNASGPHLHFEVMTNGRTLNPVQFL